MCFNKDSGANTSITILVRICSWHLRWAPHRAEHLVHTTQQHVIDGISTHNPLPVAADVWMQAVWEEALAYCQEPHTNRFDLRSEAYIQAWLKHDYERLCMRQWNSSSTLYNTPTSAVSQGIYQMWVFSIHTRFSACVCLAWWDQRPIFLKNN